MSASALSVSGVSALRVPAMASTSQQRVCLRVPAGLASGTGRAPLPRRIPAPAGCAASSDGLATAVATTSAAQQEVDNPYAEYDAWLEKEVALTMEEYGDLKKQMLKRVQRAATLFTLYCYGVFSGPAALAAGIGGIAGYGYLCLLMREVDNITPDDEVPMFEADAIEAQPARFFARIFAGYRYAVRARLLVPVALGLGLYVYNTQVAAPGYELGSLEEGCLLGGFLMYKSCQVLAVWDSIKPKVETADEKKMRRPKLPNVGGEDATLLAAKFDIYGREIKEDYVEKVDKAKDDV